MTIFMSSMIVMVVSITIMSFTSFLSKKSMEDREKSSPFECGFDPKNSARIPFSMQFFLIAVVFLIFDVEIALLLPMSIILPLSTLFNWSMISFFFLLILLIGLYHEWNQGSLEWAS
uniref:NADH-ubiquinone oxidoreductase chain 3 n=1 Tax=Amazonina sp. Z256E TaxID=2093491 RepID=A0A2P1H9Y2_9NEOP|nr:NADH dehydrogenase subunit 3 [Amazonina sp. Z256E]